MNIASVEWKRFVFRSPSARVIRVNLLSTHGMIWSSKPRSVSRSKAQGALEFWAPQGSSPSRAWGSDGNLEPSHREAGHVLIWSCFELLENDRLTHDKKKLMLSQFPWKMTKTLFKTWFKPWLNKNVSTYLKLMIKKQTHQVVRHMS